MSLPLPPTLKERVTTDFQDDPLRNLVMNQHSLTGCYPLIEDNALPDLERLLKQVQRQTRGDLIVYRDFALRLSGKAKTDEEKVFIRAFLDGPLQVLSSFSLALEFCLLLLSRGALIQLENELRQLQQTLKKNIDTCYHWAKQQETIS